MPGGSSLVRLFRLSGFWIIVRLSFISTPRTGATLSSQVGSCSCYPGSTLSAVIHRMWRSRRLVIRASASKLTRLCGARLSLISCQAFMHVMSQDLTALPRPVPARKASTARYGQLCAHGLLRCCCASLAIIRIQSDFGIPHQRLYSAPASRACTYSSRAPRPSRMHQRIS
ncbi:hypothetical protein B0H15DRAFT_299577 [Mycena belliarum]|uniref:Secreted protein n=1 Tax=Mycena belliarum TaxID=1033014 RepID=A0AAD6XRK9_9AGAR|nr:hypothetical protein B0H15DRAFT_299577 [Mycena belliae]